MPAVGGLQGAGGNLLGGGHRLLHTDAQVRIGGLLLGMCRH
jgi:hypothetical protein